MEVVRILAHTMPQRQQLPFDVRFCDFVNCEAFSGVISGNETDLVRGLLGSHVKADGHLRGTCLCRHRCFPGLFPVL